MIELQNIKPIPLLPNGIQANSQTWGVVCNFKKGKKYLVSAPSGKGKSTFIHIIYGLRSDYEGQLLLEGKNIKSFDNEAWSEIRQNKLSVVFQNLRLFLNLTALENIQIKNDLHQHKSLEEIKDMAKLLGVEELLDKNCATLSYGQRQRIAIIRSLCQPFDFLLLDEPFSHLDEGNIKKASSLIEKECNDQKAGLILVSLGEPYSFNYDGELIL